MSEEDKKIRAIRESISHWEKDIVKPLEKGNSITGTLESNLVWVNTKKSVECYASSCALCEIFYHTSDNLSIGCCGKCPLYQSGFRCLDSFSPYKLFYHNPCLKTAQNMVLVLQQVLIDALEEKRWTKKCGEFFSKPIIPIFPEIKAGQIWQHFHESKYVIIKGGYRLLLVAVPEMIIQSSGIEDITRSPEDWRLCPNAKIKVEEE